MANITGTSLPNVLNGTNGPDQIDGLEGNDIINGRGGDDVIIGGRGGDRLTGGTGSDTFLYKATNNTLESLPSNPDVVVDFNADEDILDVEAIDADSTQAGNQAFIDIGENSFSQTPGEMRFDVTNGRVEADRNGDGIEDFLILFLADTPIGTQTALDVIL